LKCVYLKSLKVHNMKRTVISDFLCIYFNIYNIMQVKFKCVYDYDIFTFYFTYSISERRKGFETFNTFLFESYTIALSLPSTSAGRVVRPQP
jgi:hypothetical protein